MKSDEVHGLRGGVIKNYTFFVEKPGNAMNNG